MAGGARQAGVITLDHGRALENIMMSVSRCYITEVQMCAAVYQIKPSQIKQSMILCCMMRTTVIR